MGKYLCSNAFSAGMLLRVLFRPIVHRLVSQSRRVPVALASVLRRIFSDWLAWTARSARYQRDATACISSRNSCLVGIMIGTGQWFRECSWNFPRNLSPLQPIAADWGRVNGNSVFGTDVMVTLYDPIYPDHAGIHTTLEVHEARTNFGLGV